MGSDLLRARRRSGVCLTEIKNGLALQFERRQGGYQRIAGAVPLTDLMRFSGERLRKSLVSTGPWQN